MKVQRIEFMNKTKEHADDKMMTIKIRCCGKCHRPSFTRKENNRIFPPKNDYDTNTILQKM